MELDIKIDISHLDTFELCTYDIEFIDLELTQEYFTNLAIEEKDLVDE